MKKYLKYIIGLIVLILFIVLLVFLLSRYDIMKCSSNSIKEDNYTIDSTYIIYYKKDIVKKVLIERKVTSKNNTILEFFEKNYKDEFKGYNKSYGGYTISSKTNNNTMILSVELDFNKINYDKFKQKNTYLKDYISNKQFKLDGVYTLFQLSKNSCK